MKNYSSAKRILSMILSCAMAMGVMTACSGGTESSSSAAEGSSSASSTESGSEAESSEDASGDEGGDKVIRVCWWGNQTRNDVTTQALDLYTEQNPNVTFEVEFSDWSGYWDKLATQAAGGNMADIIQMDYSYLKQYQEQNLLEGLNKYIDDGTIDTTNIVDSIIQSGAIDGEVYAISLGTNAKAVLVNNAALEAAGVEMPEQPTYNEFFEIAKKVTDATGMKFGIPSNDEQSMLFIARDRGLDFFNEDGTALGMPDDSVALTYFTMLKDTLDQGIHTEPEIMAESSTNQLSLFASGDSWCEWTNSNMIVNTIALCPEDIDYSIVMYPTEEDAVQQPIFMKPSQFFSVTTTSENKDEAAKVIDFFTNSVEANEILLGERGVPISTEVSNAIKDKLDPVSAAITEYIEKVSEVASENDPPFPAAAGEVGSLISDLADMVRYGEITPEQAASDFYEQANEILARGAQG